ncbi:MAG: hypothetical protein ACOVLC_10100 [Flavobacterium sp.]
MTAVVGILNKHAIAIAADSAVTIGGNTGSKIFNKANKVFTLSKHHPVGIMIYNSATFMSTPWETIIKIYRNKLGDTHFSTLYEYKQDFIEFLKIRNFYTDVDTQKSYFESFINEIINSLIQDVCNKDEDLIDNIEKRNITIENTTKFLNFFESFLDIVNSDWCHISEFCPEFVDYSFEMFSEYSNDVISKIIQYRFIEKEILITSSIVEKLKLSIFYVLRAQEEASSYTGLIFTGFGEDEIYPQLIPVNISFVLDNRLRYYVDRNRASSISNYNSGAVCAFAQTDVIDTILTGIDPTLDNIYLNNFKALFERYNKAIIDIIAETNPLLKEQIQNLDLNLVVSEFKELNQQIKREHHILPLMNAVSNLAKEDLSEMAESLIYLTYLKRRITFAEESVGGPVDVAIISKGDGFVWIKRKHYFRPELNQHFFDNYFKK